MPTRNYNFTYIDDIANIDIAGDTKTFLDEIDATIHYERCKTFGDMVVSLNGVIGSVYKTEGYRAPGDGGGGTYKLVSGYTEGYFAYPTNRGILQECEPGIIHAAQWGILPDGGDCSAPLNLVLSRMDKDNRNDTPLGSCEITFLDGIHVFKSPVEKIVPAGTTLTGTHQPVPYVYEQDTAAGFTRDLTGGTAFKFNSAGTLLHTDFRCRIRGIMFYSTESYTWANNSDNYTTHPEGTEWACLTEAKQYECNGVDMSQTFLLHTAFNCSIENCSFYGFSGYGIKPSAHALISHCVFNECHIGMMGADAQMTDNCFFGNGGYGIVSNNVRVSNTWFDSLIHHAIYSGAPIFGTHDASKEEPQGIRGEVQGCVFDHIQFSAIRALSCGYNGFYVDSSFSRCGFYRAGMTCDDAVSALAALSDRPAVNTMIDGMCAINIPIGNNLKVRGNIVALDFLDSGYTGKFSCPQFALSSLEFGNGELDYIPYNNDASNNQYQMLPSFWWTKDGFNSSLFSAANMRYKYGTVRTGKTVHASNLLEGVTVDSATGITYNLLNGVFSFIQVGWTKSAGTYNMDALPGYTQRGFAAPVYSSKLGYVGYIVFALGKNKQPVLHLTQSVSADTVFCTCPMVLDTLERMA